VFQFKYTYFQMIKEFNQYVHEIPAILCCYRFILNITRNGVSTHTHTHLHIHKHRHTHKQSSTETHFHLPCTDFQINCSPTFCYLPQLTV